ncbi:penicillin-binding transpeptidase domain-containing protein [Geomonas sp.]|uniref:penicillin-binding transpeptidase domain-containing protein n=1 Tax=Geomonas sp. TaxID=2651584 RepID=UPI002B48374D|nr:penicillin-binding transpeptidase domain-containing protein [Geomonas sp.]HJV33912.1 penicillin-binding transpeptidase domain-containing protein [Geomonas sp.]
MQDFKDLHKQHRRRATAGNAFRDQAQESEPQKTRRLRIILPLVALLLASYPIISIFGSTRSKTSPPAAKPAAVQPIKLNNLDNWSAFRLAADAYPNISNQNGTFSAPLPQGGKVVYAINEPMQRRVEKLMNDYKVPYGLFVAIEPKTGRVLATVAHSSIQPGWEKGAFYNTYPMASLFKIVTATAALEEKKVGPDTPFAFNGKLTSESPKRWHVRPGRGNQQMPLSLAMGKSVNPVFGRLAGEVVGRDPLIFYADRYGFNQSIFPGSPVVPSAAPAPPPGSVDQLMLMGAGLNHEVKISPFHAASIMATVANRGVMMAPSLAKEIVDQKGTVVFAQKPQPLRTVTTPETAASLARMLSTTVQSGTSRKAFHDRRGRPMLASLRVAAKTGSIDGKDPAGHYSWFAAYAPMEDPQIALAALVINQNKWRIKATSVGEQALEAFFK